MILDLDKLIDDALARFVAKAPAPVEALDVAFMKREAYASRVSLSPRKLDELIVRGLPTIGKARLLRIDVAAADAWLRQHLSDDAPEAEDEVSKAAQASVDKALRGSR